MQTCVSAQIWGLLYGKHRVSSPAQHVFIVLLLYAGHWARSWRNAHIGGIVSRSSCRCRKSHRNISQAGGIQPPENF